MAEAFYQEWGNTEPLTEHCLDGWLKKQPPGGLQKRWRDIVKADLKVTGLLDTLYTSALHRDQWDNLYNEKMHNSQHHLRVALPTVQCTVCART